jgi:hypothetical protein
MPDNKMPLNKSPLAYWRFVPMVVASMVLAASPIWAQAIRDPRDIAMEQINATPPFLVRVEVDHPDHVYRQGDAILISVRSERAGYLYLFYCDASQQVTCLFPNEVQDENCVPANETIVIPDQRARFKLRVGPPFGNEVLKAVVTTEPLESLDPNTLVKGGFTPLKPQKLKAVFVEVDGGDNNQPVPQQTRLWSEHHVQVTTLGGTGEVPSQPNLGSIPRLENLVAPMGQPSTGPPHGQPNLPIDGRPKRVGVFIGVSNYQDPEIRPLKTADRDAQALAAVMKEKGQLDETAVLVNEKATLANIQAVLHHGLPAATRPGDLVIIYWSGHGGRTSNLDGTEPDGYDEYLVPHDGRLEPADAIRRTMLLDKTFGRWVQSLDGRKLIVIIDACHSGGQTQGAIKALTGGSPDAPFRKFFFATTLQRTKDIGQRETAVLASSRASQVSFERRGRDLSVMTHFLIEKLGGSADPVTLQQAADYLVEQVPAFVEQHYAGTTQTPVFVNQTTPPVFLRP